jgi:hypothetical protein
MGNYLPQRIFGYERQETIYFLNGVVVVIVTAIVAIVSTMLYFIITRQHWRNRLMTRRQREVKNVTLKKREKGVDKKRLNIYNIKYY